jgi:hypothetical protein
MNAIIIFGLVALAALTFSTLPTKADTPDTGFPCLRPTSSIKKASNRRRLQSSKPGKVVGEQKQKMSKAGKKRTKRV